jgi:CHAD domain-containing protein
MRVACRRLRSDLRTFAALLDEPRAELLREELAWLSGALAEARDLEVLLVRVVRSAAADQHFPVDPVALEAVLGLLREQEFAALAVAHDAVNSDRYLGLLRLLVELAEDPQWAPLARERCRDVLPGLVGATWRHLAKWAEHLRPDDPDEAWHRARILAKRARYATELAAVALGKDAKAAARAATAIQEHLGDHQDAAVAAERLLALPLLRPGDTALATTCGRLAERDRSVVLELRRSFPARWRGVRRGRATRWLGE